MHASAAPKGVAGSGSPVARWPGASWRGMSLAPSRPSADVKVKSFMKCVFTCHTSFFLSFIFYFIHLAHKGRK
jgi:hypothetical protein